MKAKQTSPKQPASRTKERTTWQADKSLATRNKILNAAMACLVQSGYAGTTTERVASKAKLSRGAMTHHFKTRISLFSALCEYIVDLRLEEFQKSVIFQKREGEKEIPAFEEHLSMLQATWKYYSLPSYIALQELMFGSRTDKALRKILQPLEKAFDAEINRILLERIPIWTTVPEVTVVMRDLVLLSMQGAILDHAGQVKGTRLDNLIEMLAHISYSELTRAIGEAERTRKGTVPS